MHQRLPINKSQRLLQRIRDTFSLVQGRRKRCQFFAVDGRQTRHLPKALDGSD